MVEKHAFNTLLRASRGDAAVLLATFLLTIFRGLTEAIVVGFALGSVLFIHRMSRATAIATHTALVREDVADGSRADRHAYDETISANPNVVIYRITGAFFFGAAATIGSVLDRIAPTHRLLIVDLEQVPFVDSTQTGRSSGHSLASRRGGVGPEFCRIAAKRDSDRSSFAGAPLECAACRTKPLCRSRN